jgi:alpha-1,2-mannosyltransferase
VAVLGFALAVSVYALAIHLAGPAAARPVDLRVYLAGGRAVRHHTSLYGPGFHGANGLPFTYPPFAAVLMAPLTLVPFRLLAVLWDAGSLVVLGAALAAVLGPWEAGPLQRHPWMALAAVVALSVLTEPVFDNLSLGQVDIFLAAASLTGACATERRPWTAGLIGLAAAVKVVPGLFVVYLLLARRWRAAGVAAGAFAVATAVGYLVRPASSAAYFLRLLWQVGRPGNPSSYLNQSLWGIVDRIRLGPARDPALDTLLVVVACIGMIQALRLNRQGASVAAALAVGVLSVLLSPISWIHEAIWLTLAAGALAVGRWRGRRMGLWAAGGLGLLLALRLPAAGRVLVAHGLLTPVAAVLEDAVGLVAVGVILWAPAMARSRPAPDAAAPGPQATADTP